MAKRQTIIPQYGTVMKRGVLYYRTRIKDANGKLVAIYAKTPEELYNKETLALEQIENATFHRKTPTVAEYCEKWLLMQSVHVRATTLTDYTSTVQYLAGHESSKITMDIYAKVKYNRPDELVRSMNCAFASWDAAQ